MFIYEQSTGRLVLLRDGGSPRLIANGYSGAPACINDPSQDHVKACGPIPKGRYRMRVAGHPRFAAPAIQLTPLKGTDAKGRSGFWVHGDNSKGDRSGSSGCIILARDRRQAVSDLMTALGEHYLEVVR